MVYKVIRPFKDLRDPKKHCYKVGDNYPRVKHKLDKEFAETLLNGANSAGSIFLMNVEDKDMLKDDTLTTEVEKEETKVVDGKPEEGDEE
ncbi:TPA: hypothetical protein V0X52_001877 [Streptococcus pneumoniae]|nr:hypothetical protein [Streptococcus pneumoniae]